MNIQCSICTEIFTGKENEAISSMKCGHVFHHRCIFTWVEKAKTCPLCRKTQTINDIVVLILHIEGEASNVGRLKEENEVLLSINKQLEKENKELRQKNLIKQNRGENKGTIPGGLPSGWNNVNILDLSVDMMIDGQRFNAFETLNGGLSNGISGPGRLNRSLIHSETQIHSLDESDSEDGEEDHDIEDANTTQIQIEKAIASSTQSRIAELEKRNAGLEEENDRLKKILFES